MAHSDVGDVSSSGFGQTVGPRRLRIYGATDLEQIADRAGLGAEELLMMRAVAAVLPFRANSYVLDELIDWTKAPDDPIFRMVVPQPEMLAAEDLAPVVRALQSGAVDELELAVRRLRQSLNPHPGRQVDLNVPFIGNERLHGTQHKYAETLLVFPRQGQTCHSYCTYCFRWAQFVSGVGPKMALRPTNDLRSYLVDHSEITDVLLTGGDPMVMRAGVLAQYFAMLLDPELHLETIRIGSKALAFWPYRFVTDPDADELLDLFRSVVDAGKNLAFMAHFSHPRELETQIVADAVGRLRGVGAHIYAQAPLLRHINDDPDVWARMWRYETRLGMTPYYMFVERDTGPQNYFAVPLARAVEIFRTAFTSVSGLSRTVRGPIMSAAPGKVCIDGVTQLFGEKVFSFHFVQARQPELVNVPMFAQYDAAATWLSDLRPAFGEAAFRFRADGD